MKQPIRRTRAEFEFDIGRIRSDVVSVPIFKRLSPAFWRKGAEGSQYLASPWAEGTAQDAIRQADSGSTIPMSHYAVSFGKGGGGVERRRWGERAGLGRFAQCATGPSLRGFLSP